MAAIVLSAHAQTPRPADLTDLDRPFDRYSWITAHNAANHGSLVPNQSMSIEQQLARGVRGLMLDVHEHQGRLLTCHADCAFHGRKAPLEEDLQHINAFPESHPDAVVTLHLEDHYPRDAMEAFAREFPHLFRRSFNPTDPRWNASGPGWPTLRELISADQRLLVTTQRAALSGAYPGSRAWFMHDQDVVAENYWSLGDTVFSHDNRCVPRWSHIPLDQLATPSGRPRLFVMNHFHGVPFSWHSGIDNRLDTVLDRLSTHCLPAAARMPNYLAIDFIEWGDMLEYAETYNNGGLLAHDGNNADGPPICTFSTTFNRSWSLKSTPRMGCGNDEIRSVTLQGARRGQRITFHDDPGGSSSDDYTTIEILQDIAWDAPQVIGTLEKDLDTTQVRVRHHHVNGLDGKVSRISVDSGTSR